MDTRGSIAGVKRQDTPDVLQGKTQNLSLPDKLQTLNIVI